MFRRWMIRGVLLFFLAAFVAGWGVSTCCDLACGYFHRGNMVFCSLTYGVVEVGWGRGIGSADGWDPRYNTHRFHLVWARFLWQCTSTAWPNYTEFRVSLVGFRYDHRRQGITSRVLSEDRMLGVPLWFLIVLTTAGLWWAWKKTRLKLDPLAAFPVELRS